MGKTLCYHSGFNKLRKGRFSPSDTPGQMDFQIRATVKYLNQVIRFFPTKPKKPEVTLSKENMDLIDEIAELLYESGVEDYAQADFKTVKEQLLNAAKAGHLDCIEKAWYGVEDFTEPDYPVGESGQYENRPMRFWNLYRDCKERKKRSKK